MNVTIQQIAIEIHINAPIAKVWDTVLNRTSDWWPGDFLCHEGSKEIKMEPFVGGRIYEETADGKSLLWGTLVNIHPNKTLEFIGHSTPQFGGPSLSMGKYELTESESNSTNLQFTNVIMGNCSDEGTQMVTEGWNYLLGELKNFAEK